MIGSVISDRYVVEAVVGTGGMAIVYRAYDKISKTRVAIKVLRPEFESDEEFVRRFSREAEAASKVSHENIVNVLDVGTDGHHRYIVMEFVDGQTLKEMIRQRGRIEPDLAIRMTIRILAAVDQAHRNGIVHRDIKPQNILVDRQGRVKVADFGIARLKTSQTTQIEEGGSSSALGSVHYFSPEQAQGEIADEKSDLYSVGVVLYEMLTGQVPFDGETAVSVALKHVQEAPKSMRLFQSGISKALDEVVMRVLCKDTTKRYQTAAEMAADLRKTITHPRGGFVKYPQSAEEIEAERESRRKLRQRARKKAAHIAIVVAVLSLIAFLAWGAITILGMRDRVIVPSVTGLSVSEAQNQLERAHLVVNIASGYSEEYERGLVAEQSLEPGERATPNSEITVVVSMGSEWYYLDDLTGMTEREAVARVQASDVANLQVEYVLSEAEPDTVLTQTLEPGYHSRTEPLTIRISGRTVEMPSLIGLTPEGARRLIESEGLIIGTITEVYSADAPGQTVIAQSIEPDATVLENTPVDISVSPAMEKIYRPERWLSVAVPLDDLPVRITLSTPTGAESEACSETLSRGMHFIDLTSAEPGLHQVRVYMSDVLMETTELMFD